MSSVILEVADLNNEIHVAMPTVYSTPHNPIRPECIGKQEDVNRWPHLKGKTIQHIDAETDLLIGSDVPDILQPREVRQRENGDPFAIKAVLGRILNETLGRKETKFPTTNFVKQTSCSTSSSRTVETWNAKLRKQRTCKNFMSQSDKKALGVMEQTVKMVNSHYEIGLSWIEQSAASREQPTKS